MTMGMRTAAETTRTATSRLNKATGLDAAGAVTPLAPLEICNRLGQMVTGKVRPQRVGEDQFRIGRLPQQEIRQALLAGGADQQVRIRHVGGLQVASKQGLVDRIGIQPASRRLRRQSPAGSQNFILAAVVQGEYQR